jgi:hypothetical protein
VRNNSAENIYNPPHHEHDDVAAEETNAAGRSTLSRKTKSHGRQISEIQQKEIQSEIGQEQRRQRQKEKGRRRQKSAWQVAAFLQHLLFLRQFGWRDSAVSLVDGDHEIDCKMNGISIGLKACFVKKA